MTESEAIKIIEETSPYECVELCVSGDCETCKISQAPDLAIKALEKQIGREAVKGKA